MGGRNRDDVILSRGATQPVILSRGAAKDLTNRHGDPVVPAFVYIMASHAPALYVGVTSDLRLRVAQHRQHTFPRSFTAQYRITRLVYFEELNCMATAIAREKQIKGWRRARKIALIEQHNPAWHDLAVDWFPGLR